MNGASAPPTGGPSARLRGYASWAIRHGRLLWILAALLAVPALVRTVGLYARLKSDLEELLPSKAPSVLALDELRARMPGIRFLGVLVDVGKRENLAQGEHLLDDLAARVRKYPKALVASVRLGVEEEQAFLERNAPLYVDIADLRSVRQRIEEQRDYAVSKGMGLGLEDDEPAPKLDFSDLEKKYRSDDLQRFPNGRFSNPDQHLTLMLIEAATFTTGADLGKELFRRVRADLHELGGPDKYAPGMRIGFTGDLAINVEEMSALVSDLSVSSIVVVLFVLTILLVFYRWWKSVLVLMLPLLLAALYAFALVTLPPISIDNLNSNTAFLGSVIVGNGLNFGVILLARYVEERRRGQGIEEAMVMAIWGSRVGTIIAALAAATAYGSLMLTQFRGFHQFGVIGAIGMVACWGAAFLLTPSLVAWLDRDGSSLRSRGRHRLMGQVAGFVGRYPGPIVAVAAVLSVLSLWRVQSLDSSWIEYDFSKLRRKDSRVVGEAYWGQRMDRLLGRYLTPVAILTDNPEDTQRIAARLKDAAAKPPLHQYLAEVRSAEDVVPSDQQAKIAETRAIRGLLTPRIRAELDERQRRAIERFLPEGSLKPLDARDLPHTMTAGLREHGGRLDRAVLVYPRPGEATWHGDAIATVTSELRRIAGSEARVAGSMPLSSDIISSIKRDGPLATAVALFGVVVLVAAIFRFTRYTLLIIGSLVTGVLWLTAAIMALHVKINFCNLIAFPITFGIGVDYSVNVIARYREGGGRDVLRAIQSTGGAVTLCSLTTITGYGSLLFAQNQALFLFGAVAVLGEITCLVSAVVVMPALLSLRPRALEQAAPLP